MFQVKNKNNKHDDHPSMGIYLAGKKKGRLEEKVNY